MNLSIAVLVHKIPESLALSLNFNRETLKLSSIVLAIFAISGPIGIITGMILQDMAGPVA